MNESRRTGEDVRHRVHIYVKGRVQGVCYRMTARDEADRLGLTGWVRLEYVVTADGTTRDIRVLESKGGRRFEEAAISGVRQWRYRPGRLEGNPVSVRGSIKITFKLEE